MQPRKVLLAFFILISCFCAGQSDTTKKISKGGIGISLTPFGRNTVYAGMEVEEMGRGIYSFSNTPFYAGNLYGFLNIRKNTRLVIGFGYCYHEISAKENYLGDYYYYNHNIKVFSIPIYIEKTLFRYIFIRYGGIVNLEYNFVYDHSTRINKQKGIGLITNLGGTYHFKSGITVFAGPSVFIYNILILPSILGDMVAGLGAEFGLSVDL
jgi:hypothetical protein